jgi:hypothetical protein
MVQNPQYLSGLSPIFHRMRYYGFILIFLVLLVMISGCTQSPTTPKTAPTTTIPTLSSMSTVATGPKQINVSAWKTEHEVVIQYNGGKDATDLTSLKVQIDNQNGLIIKRTFDSPQIGTVYPFPYTGTPDATSVNVIGIFADGTQQTVLLINF